MAAITIRLNPRNRDLAARLAQTGASVEEHEPWLTISQSPELVIPRDLFERALDAQAARPSDADVDRLWRALVLNKRGHLQEITDDQIRLTDARPKVKRPQFLLRFPDHDSKDAAEAWAQRAGFPTLTEYILSAIEAYNDFWSRQAGDPE